MYVHAMQLIKKKLKAVSVYSGVLICGLISQRGASSILQISDKEFDV
jgi:hypothetical protein